MITWNDFILDDFFGPVLNFKQSLQELELEAKIHEGLVKKTLNKDFTEETQSGSSHQEDEDSTYKKRQETEHMQRLARMAGQLSSDAETHMDVGSNNGANKSVKEGGT